MDEIKLLELENLEAVLQGQIHQYNAANAQPARRIFLFRPQKLPTIALDSLFNATLNKLTEQLHKTYHIVLFVGHGSPQEIYLEDDSGYHAPLKAADLSDYLTARGVQLIFLAGCQTATQALQIDEPLASFAQALAIEGQIPAVIAMQTKVSIANATKLVGHFFDALSKGYPVDTALADARQTLLVNGEIERDVIAPVLYLQSENGDLFPRAVNPLVLLLQALAVVLFFVLALVIGLSAYRGRLDAVAIRDAQVAAQAERETRLQTVGQLNRRQSIPIGAGVGAPVLGGPSLWVSSSSAGKLWRVSLAGDIQPALDVGSQPGQPVFDGTYVWISSADGLRRVNPNTNQIDFIPLTGSISTPIIVGDSVWVQSFNLRSVTAINRQTLQVQPPLTTDVSARAAFAAGAYLWVLIDGTTCEQRGGCLLQFSPDQEQHIALTSLADGIAAGSALWLVKDQRLLQFDPSQMQLAPRVIDTGTALASLTDEGGSLWAVSRDGNSIFRIDPASGTLQKYAAVSARRVIASTADHFWVVTASDLLLMLSMTDGAQVTSIALPGSAQVTQAISDQSDLWITVPAENTVLVVDVQTGAEGRRFLPCGSSSPLGPVFDGANVWFACPGRQELLSLPAVMHYFGTQRFQANTFEQAPLVVGNYLWIVQEEAERILVYDGANDSEVATLQFKGAPLLPLVEGGGYLWTATQGTGQVIRITPQFDANGNLSEPPLSQALPGQIII